MEFLLFGFLGGLTHSWEADHVATVENLVNNSISPIRVALLGLIWGAGHTLTILILTIAFIGFNLRWNEIVSNILELLVGLLLLFMAESIFYQFYKKYFSNKLNLDKFHKPPQQKIGFSQQKISLKILFIGSLHGATGLGTILSIGVIAGRDMFSALEYILIFGIGSMIGMGLLTLSIAWSFKKIKKIHHLSYILKLGFAGFALIVGISLIIKTVPELIG